MDTNGKIFVALDGLGKKRACQLIHKLADCRHAASIGGFKIHDLWDQEGPAVVVALREAGASGIWVDLKLDDTPTTVKLRARAVMASAADFVSVHVGGGIEMMKQAVLSGLNIIAITVLTSLSEKEIHLLCGQPAKSAALLRAQWAKLAGVWAVVCSSHEVGELSRDPSLSGLRFIVPGIRLAGKEATDANQKRVDSPKAAFAAGADYIVVGSELTRQSVEDPVAVFDQIVAESQDGLAARG